GANLGREDALTELWKAELTHVQYRAVDLYRTGTGGDRMAEAIAWAKAALARESPKIPHTSEQRAAGAPPLAAPGSMRAVEGRRTAPPDRGHSLPEPPPRTWKPAGRVTRSSCAPRRPRSRAFSSPPWRPLRPPPAPPWRPRRSRTKKWAWWSRPSRAWPPIRGR